MVTLSKETVETAKKHYKITAFQQTYFQTATKSILNRLGINPLEQGYYFAFNDQIFSLTSKFGNGLIGKQTVLKTAHLFSANYVAMLGSKFDLVICNQILQLYNISAYSPIPLIPEYYVNPLLDLAFLLNLDVQNISPILSRELTLELFTTRTIILYFANKAEPRLVETETSSNTRILANEVGSKTVTQYFRVFKVSGGVETELTSGWTFGGSRTSNGVSEKDTDWICPATSFLVGDKIRVYIKVTVGSTSSQASWDSVTTYKGLLAQTWTLHLWLEKDYFAGYTDGSFYFGAASVYPSRITNVGVIE